MSMNTHELKIQFNLQKNPFYLHIINNHCSVLFWPIDHSWIKHNNPIQVITTICGEKKVECDRDLFEIKCSQWDNTIGLY